MSHGDVGAGGRAHQVRPARGAVPDNMAQLPRVPLIVRWWRWLPLQDAPVPQQPERDQSHDGDDQKAAGDPPGDAHITEITVLRQRETRFRGSSIKLAAAEQRRGVAHACDRADDGVDRVRQIP